MKESIGGTWLFTIVIFFVILFTGYMCLSINHTKAFNVKNALIRIIERNGSGKSSAASLGLDIYFIDEVREELEEVGYRVNGKCQPGWTAFNENGQMSLNSDNAAFCIRRISSSSGNLGAPMYYYQVETFYHLEIPIIRSIFRLSIKGDTKPMI